MLEAMVVTKRGPPYGYQARDSRPNCRVAVSATTLYVLCTANLTNRQRQRHGFNPTSRLDVDLDAPDHQPPIWYLS